MSENQLNQEPLKQILEPSINPKTIEARTKTMQRLVTENNIELDPEWNTDKHFWYLVNHHYGEEWKNTVQSLKTIDYPINKNTPFKKLNKPQIERAVKLASEYATLQKEAATDGLTGAFNRRALDKYLLNLLGHQRQNEANAIVMLDIDNFKQFNDIHGHLVGDEVLRQLVKLINGQIRGIDFLARYGGEEFMLIRPGIDKNDEKWKENILERVDLLRRKIALELKTNMKDSNNKPLNEKITASFGVMFMDHLPTVTNVEELKKVYNKVDKQLYLAKTSGRNCVFGPVGKFISNSQTSSTSGV